MRVRAQVPRWLSAGIAGLLFAATAGRAAPPPPPPVCGDADVLAWVAQRLRERNLSAQIDPRTVGEAPGPSGDIVGCGVYAQVFVYDTNQHGATPLSRYEAHTYFVRTRPNGFIVLSVD